ncbi:hypothetical protein NHP200010_04140 [Helicobacter bizzozeronii]|nr:hypothetical protein NHP200010_04140 [Helicobacter bizzozeronii]
MLYVLSFWTLFEDLRDELGLEQVLEVFGWGLVDQGGHDITLTFNLNSGTMADAARLNYSIR